MPSSDHPQPPSRLPNWYLLDLPQTDYVQALDMQHRLVAARKDGRLARDTLLFLEHPPVYTLGKHGGRENLKVTDNFLQQSGIQVVPIERGGNITYHGPGQLVVYIIIHLSAARLSVDDFVSGLEAVMIRTARKWDIAAGRSELNRGVWVGSRKMGSIGIAIRKGISFHGLAMNVNTDLKPFSWINPCGLNGVGITSFQQECGRAIAMGEVRREMRKHFVKVFHRPIDPIDLNKLEEYLNGMTF
jgi:lipoate-protein ligase B